MNKYLFYYHNNIYIFNHNFIIIIIIIFIYFLNNNWFRFSAQSVQKFQFSMISSFLLHACLVTPRVSLMCVCVCV